MKLAVVMPRSRYASELEARSSGSEREETVETSHAVCEMWERIVAVW